MLQYKTYQIKLKPTKAQEQTFEQWLGTCRYVYNLALETKEYVYRAHGIRLSYNDLQKQLPDLKKDSWIKNVYAQTLQDVLIRLFTAYDGYFNVGRGFPKWAKKSEYRSFTIRQGPVINEKERIVKLPKIGKVKYYGNRQIKGEIKVATVIKKSAGWFISFQCITDINPLPPLTNQIGIDVGLKTFLVTSTGESIANPKNLRDIQKRINKANKSLTRKKLGSNNRKKAAQKLAKLHFKATNKRKDFQQKLSTKLIRENQTIVVEDIRINNLLQNHRLAGTISDAAWGNFFLMLEYKAKWYGRTFVRVAPHYTTQNCSVCSYRNTDLTLKIREWTCPVCNTLHCRDTNAATNILNKGLAA